MAKKIIPMTATFDEICKLKRDHVDAGDFSIMTDSFVVWLSEQKNGEDRRQHFKISRKNFNKLILWYTTNSMRPMPRAKRKAGK